MSAETAQTAEKIITVVQRLIPEAIAVYLFGSAVGHQMHRESDIDVAVLLRRPISHMERFDLQEQLAFALKKDVDLVDLRQASTVMRMQVIGTGLLLYETDMVARQFFEMYASADYALLNEERAAILKDIRRKGRVYDR